MTPVLTPAPRDPYARLARGCRPRGCRAPARRVHGRRVRYVIGDEPGQVNGMRWLTRPVRGAGAVLNLRLRRAGASNHERPAADG
ncbi:tryptophan biosynthesis modulator TrpM [Streptomyces tendae]|uniref:tryptophan biosynthesis modulator TrpM n=1 Tax=Streptomyces tendae TaxID=1932 RepID=UPI003570F293